MLPQPLVEHAHQVVRHGRAGVPLDRAAEQPLGLVEFPAVQRPPGPEQVEHASGSTATRRRGPAGNGPLPPTADDPLDGGTDGLGRHRPDEHVDGPQSHRRDRDGDGPCVTMIASRIVVARAAEASDDLQAPIRGIGRSRRMRAAQKSRSRSHSRPCSEASNTRKPADSSACGARAARPAARSESSSSSYRLLHAMSV